MASQEVACKAEIRVGRDKLNMIPEVLDSRKMYKN